MDKREFKVGDRVWSLACGWGSVVEIDLKKNKEYPMRVNFDSGVSERFTMHGFRFVRDKKPSLFLANQGKIEFDTDEPIELVDGQPIWVRGGGSFEWVPRHAKELAREGGVLCHNNGTTKHSNGTGATTHWPFFRTTDPALDGASQ